MKQFKILIIGLFFLSIGQINAQISIAPRVGFNLANFSGDIEDNKLRLRTQIGGVANIDINEMFSFQPGLIFSGKGATFDYGGDDNDAITLFYLEIPLNGVLNIEMGTGKLQIFAGPYVGFCLGGKNKYLSDEDNETESINIGTSDNDAIKPMDLGINIGLGYRFSNYQIQGGYGGSLSNISNYDDDKLKNSLISFTFAYFIKTKK